MEIHAIGIDLGKTLFHLVAVDPAGAVVVRKRCSRTQLLAFTANLRVHRIGMEACSGAHFLGRAWQAQGHDVRLMPAQYVKPYSNPTMSRYIRTPCAGVALCSQEFSEKPLALPGSLWPGFKNPPRISA